MTKHPKNNIVNQQIGKSYAIYKILFPWYHHFSIIQEETPMAIFVSNLVAGLEQGLDNPQLLLDMVKPFHNEVGIEFFIHTYSKSYMKRMEQVRTWAVNLPIALHGPFRFVEATSAPGTGEYQTFADAYDQALCLARRLGCSHLVFHSNECFVRPEEKQRLKARCLANIETLIQKAGSMGVTLLLENLALPSKGTPLFDCDEYISLFDRFPEAGCLIDVGHLAAARWDIKTVISALAPRIKGYHLHNNDGVNDSHERLKNGVIDYDSFFKLYRTYTPHGDLTLEYGDNHRITPKDMHRDIAWVAKLTQNLNS